MSPPEIRPETRGPAPESPADGLVGRVVAGRYRIRERLGRGAMGEVYLGEHLAMGRLDAIKVLSRHHLGNDALRQRFVRGARNLARIRHPNVCAVYDFGETADGEQFLAIEYVPGGTLGDLVAREGPLPTRRALRIAVQIARGLQAAHDVGIVHRDLKPENVMLATDRDEADVAKVVDFDIAKAREEEPAADVTHHGAIIGTPRYMSPEQLLGDPLDGRSDLYSLGVVTFWMLTGKLPFTGQTARDMTAHRLERDALSLEDVAPGRFPRRLTEAIARALHRRVEARHESAAAFARELEALAPGLEGSPSSDEPDDRTMILEAGAGAADAPGGPDGPPPVGTRLAPADARPVAVQARARPSTPAILVAATLVVGLVAVAVPMATRTSPSAPVESEAALPPAREGGGDDVSAAADLDRSAEPAQDSAPPATRSGREVDPPRIAAATPTPDAADSTPVPPPEPTPATAADALAAMRAFAVELAPQDASAARARLLADSARAVWARVDLEPEVRHWAAYVAGLAELNRARPDSALPWIDRALELAPTNPGYRALRDALAGGTP